MPQEGVLRIADLGREVGQLRAAGGGLHVGALGGGRALVPDKQMGSTLIRGRCKSNEL